MADAADLCCVNRKILRMKIIITGSLGNIRKPLVQMLVKGGHTVTAISSKAERVGEIESLGASAAIGTLQDVDFLSATMSNADAVYCMVPPNWAASDMIGYLRLETA